MRIDRPGILVPIVLLAACSSGDSSPDGKDEEAFDPGKADSVYGECQIRQLVAWVNDPTLTVDMLKAAGVHTRAAKNIVAYRDGLDALPGTADDDYFDDAEELDDVYWVGKRAFEQLSAAVADRCGVPRDSSVVFSPQYYSESHLARVHELLAGAQHTIDVAMYSFSDSQTQDALKNAAGRGVSVRMIFETANEDRKDPAGSRSAKFEDAGIDVRYVNKIMHHKYAIIDGPRDSTDLAFTGTLATGSGNWSYSAGTKYDENTVFLTGSDELMLRYQKEFDYLWDNSRDFEWNSDLEPIGHKTITAPMIPDDPTANVAFTSANFKTSVTSYGPTFSVVSGNNEISDKLTELIENASESIHVASGHLRSRPVSEALLAKAEANPEMDIRVYLDNQEYISEWYHNEQLGDLSDCLAEAGDSTSKQQKCLDKGFYFSYQLHEAGVEVRFKYYCYRWDYHYAEQMHHKYLIFDGKILASGSYNLSDNAEHNTMENMAIYDRSAYGQLVDAFEANFEALWATGESEGLYAALLDEVEKGSGPVPLVFEPMALDWDQVTALKAAIKANCPDINTDPYRQEPDEHLDCPR